jgi:heterotetrameric sarcosine oxidase gamma subunit
MVKLPGIDVDADAPLHAATLRYFEPAGPFAAAVAAATGTPLPAPLTATILPAVAADGAAVVLAWLRPTETLAFSEEAAPLAELKERLADAAGGHIVDLTGGLKAFGMHGTGAPELLSRLGGMATALGLNEARRGRLADVPVLAVRVRAEKTLLIVDRVYAEHLRGWIEATLADWTGCDMMGEADSE